MSKILRTERDGMVIFADAESGEWLVRIQDRAGMRLFETVRAAWHRAGNDEAAECRRRDGDPGDEGPVVAADDLVMTRAAFDAFRPQLTELDAGAVPFGHLAGMRLHVAASDADAELVAKELRDKGRRVMLVGMEQ